MNFLKLLLIYLLSGLIIYLIHINFFEVDVVLYSSLFDFGLALVVVFFLGLRFKLITKIFCVETFKSFLIFCLLGYSIAITFPTVIDRSLSFYILEKINQRGGSVRFGALKEIIINEYLEEHKLVKVRVTEQIASGTIILQDECIKLTSKGMMVVEFSNFFRDFFLPRKRLILNKYSDDLKDPLSSKIKNLEYKCR